jgi:hypothetical protein
MRMQAERAPRARRAVCLLGSPRPTGRYEAALEEAPLYARTISRTRAQGSGGSNGVARFVVR